MFGFTVTVKVAATAHCPEDGVNVYVAELVLLTVAGLQFPATPLADVAGKVGTEAPEQMVSDVPKLNVGVVFDPTVTPKVVVVAHCPAEGVNVYVAEFVLLTVAGLQVPVRPSIDVVVSDGTDPPEQMESEVPKENVGVMFGFTVTANEAVVAHCPADGVKVYVPEAVLSTVAGFHVPVILLLDVPGRTGTVPPEQTASEVPKLNVGVIFGFTVTVNVVLTAHCPAPGVKV
jgi:hypothetical protein